MSQVYRESLLLESSFNKSLSKGAPIRWGEVIFLGL